MKQFSLFIFFTTLFISCQDCTNCVSVQEINGIVIETPYDEFCGKREQLDTYEQMLQNNAPEFVTVECTRN